MFVPFFDLNYLLFSLPAILLGFTASILLKYWTNKYFSTQNINHLTGIDVVERLGRANGFNIRLEVTNGKLSDHYDPRSQTVRLSQEVAQTTSITAVGIAAHEMGHVQQHHTGNIMIKLRNTLIPTLNIGTSIGYYMLIIGIIIGLAQLAWVGIILFSGATFFSFLTLPIELDASRRALNMIQSENILFTDEIAGVKKVLFAAALTYVAATLQSLGSLLYFVFRVQGIGKRD